MRTVREVLDGKGREVWTVSPGDTVRGALETMAEHDVGALVVTDGGRPVGVFSERDYARKVILVGRASADTPVREIMTTPVVSVEPERSVEECMGIMTRRRIRHLPVTDEDRLVGVVSIGDLVKAIIDEQSFLISQLEGYIHG